MFDIGNLINAGIKIGIDALNNPDALAIATAIASLIQKLVTDPDAAAEALANTLGGQAADRIFAAQMKELSETIRTLNQLFGHVGDGLQAFDGEGFVGGDGAFIAFAPRWQILANRFNQNLTQSRAASGRMQNRCEKFWQEILPMLRKKASEVSDQEKFDKLSWYLGITVSKDNWAQALAQDEQDSQRISQEFTNIQTAIAGFRADFLAYSKAATERLDQQVTDLQNQMNTLQQKLDGIKASKDKAESVSHTGSALAGFASFFAFTGILAPVAIVCTVVGVGAAVGGAVTAEEFQRKAEDTQNQLNDTRRQLNDALKNQQRAHTVVKELVALLDGDMQTIGLKLATLSSSWEYIRVYAQEVRSSLQKSLDSKAPFIMHESAVKLSIESYKKLGACVKAYSDGFDDPERTVQAYFEAMMVASKV